MPVAARVQTTGANKVIAFLKAQSLKGRVTRRVSVGYSASYAAFVHENLAAFHPQGGQAKFLETPMRANLAEMDRIVKVNLANKESLETSLYRAGWYLLNESQPLVPVLTGFLRDSGYVKVTS